MEAQAHEGNFQALVPKIFSVIRRHAFAARFSPRCMQFFQNGLARQSGHLLLNPSAC